MEESKDAGYVRNPKELAREEWGEEECTGQRRRTNGETAADGDIK